MLTPKTSCGGNVLTALLVSWIVSSRGASDWRWNEACDISVSLTSRRFLSKMINGRSRRPKFNGAPNLPSNNVDTMAGLWRLRTPRDPHVSYKDCRFPFIKTKNGPLFQIIPIIWSFSMKKIHPVEILCTLYMIPHWWYQKINEMANWKAPSKNIPWERCIGYVAENYDVGR